ncbi:MAG: HNH endonuclease [Parasphingopyxis sp.]
MKVAQSRGYYATARLQQIIPDPKASDMYLAIMEQGTYLEFPNAVPFSDDGGPIELGVLNEAGAISGRAQSAVRPLSNSDFNRIVSAGLAENDDFLPRVDDGAVVTEVRDNSQDYIFEQSRERELASGSRIVRDRAFRQAVLRAYDCTCAITGWKLINGGGRPEVQAAHIRPVAENGPDKISNGIALSGTVHWMFDRGLISLNDDHEILVSRASNDPDSVWKMVNPSGKAIVPARDVNQPHPAFLAWHREHCFKS